MRTIYKYELEVTDEQFVDMPITGLIQSIHVLNGKICVWCEVDTKFLQGRRKFIIVGTGNPIPKTEGFLIYRDTVLMPPFVWHIYEEQGAKEQTKKEQTK